MWWRSIEASEDRAEGPMTWVRFKDLLYNYYFHDTVKDDKETEFLHLT